MKIFVFKDGVISLDKDEIALIKEFNLILRRDKSPKKEQAFKELNYIYQVADKHSYCNKKGLSKKEAHLVAVDLCNLEIDYKPDDLVIAGVRRYEQLRPSQLEDITREIRGAFNTSHRVIKALRLAIETYISKEDIKGEDLQNATVALERLLSLADSIPKKIKALKEMDELVEEEDKNYELQRGGDAIEDSMEPETAIG
jgi:hypothetical protein